MPATTITTALFCTTHEAVCLKNVTVAGDPCGGGVVLINRVRSARDARRWGAARQAGDGLRSSVCSAFVAGAASLARGTDAARSVFIVDSARDWAIGWASRPVAARKVVSERMVHIGRFPHSAPQLISIPYNYYQVLQ